MVVYIFRRDLTKFQQADQLEAAVCDKTVGIGVDVIKDPSWRETLRKVKKVPPPPKREETEQADSIIVVDPELGISADDIAEDFSFGNGATVGAVRLKSGEWVPAVWVVFDHKNKATVDSKYAQLKQIVTTHVSEIVLGT